MKKTLLYRYLGKNGLITTDVELIGVEPILMYDLTAEPNHLLTNGEVNVQYVRIFAEELPQWTEFAFTPIQSDEDN